MEENLKETVNIGKAVQLGLIYFLGLTVTESF
jgi:hypothetical protein